jgi:hypothetical protein
MNFKINSIVISSILAFALIAGIIPAGFAQNNTGMTQDGNMTQGQGGNMTGMTQGQIADGGGNDGDEDGKDGDEDGKDGGDNSEDDKDKGE